MAMSSGPISCAGRLILTRWRVVVHMLWLNAPDPEILVEHTAEDAGARLYSIDDGWYLTGQGWNQRQSCAPLLQALRPSLLLFR
jgi:hypothetical protein